MKLSESLLSLRKVSSCAQALQLELLAPTTVKTLLPMLLERFTLSTDGLKLAIDEELGRLDEATKGLKAHDGYRVSLGHPLYMQAAQEELGLGKTSVENIRLALFPTKFYPLLNNPAKLAAMPLDELNRLLTLFNLWLKRKSSRHPAQDVAHRKKFVEQALMPVLNEVDTLCKSEPSLSDLPKLKAWSRKLVQLDLYILAPIRAAFKDQIASLTEEDGSAKGTLLAAEKQYFDATSGVFIRVGDVLIKKIAALEKILGSRVDVNIGNLLLEINRYGSWLRAQMASANVLDTSNVLVPLEEFANTNFRSSDEIPCQAEEEEEEEEAAAAA
ncbi:hypothetical protein IPG41_04150 [Candidatus Peregrinibacteria bacterium]|nr:MAG: hypothetical protein IPG41_04150 [Candidatus Peregrinibacteria bacterium]